MILSVESFPARMKTNVIEFENVLSHNTHARKYAGTHAQTHVCSVCMLCCVMSCCMFTHAYKFLLIKFPPYIVFLIIFWIQLNYDCRSFLSFFQLDQFKSFLDNVTTREPGPPKESGLLRIRDLYPFVTSDQKLKYIELFNVSR